MKKENKLIEVRRAGFLNKGAHLMLLACKRFLDRNMTYDLVLETHQEVLPFKERSLLGAYQKIRIYKFGIHFGRLAVFIPKYFRKLLGIVTNKEIDSVLDAAGFNYSDQWDISYTKELAEQSRIWKKNGTKLILLPQAFGPFNKPMMANYMKTIISNSDLIYARDKKSLEYLNMISPNNQKIKLSPDITISLEVDENEENITFKNKVSIVPNARMLDKTSITKEEYISFLTNIIEIIIKKDKIPFLLIHEEGGNDKKIAERIRELSGTNIDIIVEKDPLKIKAILGSTYCNIGSRFHGLVSSLSQGVPTLATGWSHKYEMLFEDFNLPEGMLNLEMDREKQKITIEKFLDKAQNDLIRKNLKQNSNKLKKKVDEMWDEVFDVLKNS